MAAPLCFIDTETTGVHPGRQVWEIAMIRRDETGETESSFFVEVDLSDANLIGLNIGRFYERHPVGRWVTETFVTDYPTTLGGKSLVGREGAARRVARATHGAHLVGAVPNFDAETLAPLLREAGLTPSWHYHLIDVETLAVGWLRGHAAAMGTPQDLVKAADPPWDSEELTRRMGVELPRKDERHTALGDARWAMRLYDAVTRH